MVIDKRVVKGLTLAELLAIRKAVRREILRRRGIAADPRAWLRRN